MAKQASKKTAAARKPDAKAKRPAAKPVAKKTAIKKAAAAKPTVKPVAKKPVAKKPVVKKAAPKAAAARPKSVKPAARPAAKSTPVKKKVVVKKAAPKKPIVKPAAVTKTVVKKAAPKAAPASKKSIDKTAGLRLAKAKVEAKVEVKKAPVAVKLPEVPQPTGSYNGVRLAEQVKPFPKKTPYSKKEIDALRDTLSKERDQLQHELASLDNTSREVMDLSKEHPGYSLHLAEHATDLQTAEASLGVRSIVRERLEQVDTALRRVQENTAHFGLCLACGNKIGIQRLLAMPHAHLCMDCRQRYERIRSRRG